MVWKFIKSTWARDIKFVLISGLTTRLFGSFLALFLWHSSQSHVRNKWQASCVTFADLFCASQNKCQLTVIAAWRLPCELHNADRSAMTHLAFRRDIAAHLL
ncbi:hypothetical protein T08_11115 [Trichinella sp. T8]|nr:hypothetical protein T08_11115 [Trichinella sp. T8]